MHSTIHLPVNYLLFEKCCIFAGAACALFVLYLYGLLIYRNSGLGEYLIGLLFVVLAAALLNTGNRVSSLSLYPDHLVVVQRYALILKRRFIYQYSPKLDFQGKLESVFELNTEQREPEYKLQILRKRFLLSTGQRFVLSANQSQGSWLVAGLMHWREHAGLQQAK